MKTPVLIIALLGVTISPLQAETLVVPDEYSSVALALENAMAGDTVLIQPGTHAAVGLHLPDGVNLKGSGADPSQTILDGQLSGRILTCEGLTMLPTIENLTFRQGAAQGATSYDGSGGAILCSNGDVLIRDCRFEENVAQDHGGAIRSSHASPRIENCAFRGNVATGGGGALDCSYGSHATVIASTFAENRAAWGGAVSCRALSEPRLENCVLDGNMAEGSPGLGGAVFSDHEARPVLIGTVLCDNQAKNGGATASLEASGVSLEACTLAGNLAMSLGGGIFLSGATASVVGSVISFNEGTSIHLQDAAQTAIDCTDIFGNSDGDWVTAIKGQQEEPGNLAVDPLYCAMEPGAPGRFAPRDDSPLLVVQELCGQLGAMPIGCAASAVGAGLPALAVAGLAAHPNPFNPRTSINFELSRDAHVRVRVHDLRGAVVRQLADTALAAGSHSLSWNGVDAVGRVLAAGTYLVVAEADGQQLITKVALIK